MLRRPSLVFFVALLGIVLDVTSATVKVDVYVEALCPYCRNYVLQELKMYYDAKLWDAMDIHMYYAGNAQWAEKADGSTTLTCQHGPRECYLNKVINCGIARLSKSSEWFPFVYCIEKGIASNAADAPLKPKRSLRWFDTWPESMPDANRALGYGHLIKTCSAEVGLNHGDILTCAEGEEGETLHIAAFSAFIELPVTPSGVPWVVVNDKPMRYLHRPLIYLLCDEFIAAYRPAICERLGGMNDGSFYAVQEMCMRHEDMA